MDRTIDQLCYFAALTRSGLTDDVLRNVVSFICALRPEPASVSELQALLRGDFSLQQPLPAVQKAADRAVECGWLSSEKNKYSSTVAGRTLLTDSRSKFDALEETVKKQWVQAAEDVFGGIDDVDTLWNGVRAQLAVLVFRHGSSTASLLSNDSNLPAAVDGIQNELVSAASEQCKEYGDEIVLASLTSFFQLDTPESTEFIEHLLSSAFSYSALTIAPEASEYLSSSLKPLDVFLDTNFLFGLLELHDSPQNQVCQELIRIAKENKLPFTFYFFEDTLKELNAWLTSQASFWFTGPFAPRISRALSTTPGVPLFVRKYHEENAREPLDVQMYLERYMNIGASLESQGLRLFREPEQDAEDLEIWAERQASYEDFLRSRPKWKERTNQSLRHDAVLLGIVDRRRHPGMSPLVSRCILLTVDSHLVAFSRHRADIKGDRSLALYPSQLMQLIMPFIVHTERSARVLADSINIAVFQTIQFDRPRAIAAVTKYIRNIKNLSEEDAKRILCDQILLSKLSLSSEDEAGELVESALAAQTAEARKKQADAETELEQLRLEKERLHSELQAKDTQAATLTGQLGTEVTEKGELTKTVNELKAEVQSIRDKNRKNREILLFAALILCAAGVWFVPFSSVPFLHEHANILALRLTLCIALALLMVGVALPKCRAWAFRAIGIDVILGIVAAVTNKP